MGVSTMSTLINETICTVTDFTTNWERKFHNGICLFKKTENVADGLLGCDDDSRMITCNNTYQDIVDKLEKRGHGISQTSPIYIMCALSILLNIYFLVRAYYRARKNVKKDIKEISMEYQNSYRRRNSRIGNDNCVFDKSTDLLKTEEVDGHNLNQINEEVVLQTTTVQEDKERENPKQNELQEIENISNP